MKATDLDKRSNGRELLAHLFDEPAPVAPGRRRLDLDPEKVEKGLAELVLTVVELLRQVIERQALRRIEGGDLSREQIEQLGRTLMRLEQKMDELKRHFEIESLDIELGPLGRLVER